LQYFQFGLIHIQSIDGQKTWPCAEAICAKLILLSPENAISTARRPRASILYFKKGFPHDDGNREVV
jgi:hypothetical protein